MGKWEEVKLKDVIISSRSGVSRKLSTQDIGYYVVRSGNIRNGKFVKEPQKFWHKIDDKGTDLTKYILEEGDILVNFINSLAQIGKTAIFKDIGRECIFTTNIFQLKLKENLLDKYFLYYSMSEGYYKFISSITKPAVNQASFTRKNFGELPIPLPSLPEQQRIVAKLDGLFAKIDKAIGLLEENIAHTQALMGSILDEEFSKLEEFEILTIDEAKESNAIGLVRSSKIQDYNKEYDYLKMNNITRNGDLDLTNIVYVDATKEEFEKYSLKKGDFLFNTRNSIELVGKTAVYDLDKPILYNNNIMRLRFKEGINPYFVNFQFFSNKTKADLEKIKSGTTSVAAVYYKTFKNLELKIPKIETQNKLVKRLSEFSNKLKQTAEYQTQKLNHLKALKSSLLDQAFKGEL